MPLRSRQFLPGLTRTYMQASFIPLHQCDQQKDIRMITYTIEESQLAGMLNEALSAIPSRCCGA